ncbi:MAG: 16S rRNA (guanine(527)-N(7))-methyltransferase RsmG [Clostridiales bacterium]|nr:16S rRNA (guanine(527)-N(7))-methyltransferase RsmG [Clostridiales bacterium]
MEKKMIHLEKALTGLGKEATPELLEQFSFYMEAILEKNEHINLTAIKDREAFEIKHFVDSIVCIGHPAIEDAKKIVDVGTGAGFPGIPLALVYPEKEFLLFDSLNKRIKVLEEICQKMGLKNVTLLHGRAEELAKKKEHREQYDLCVSRGVAHLAILSEYCLPLVKVGGWFGAYKSQSAEGEIFESRKAFHLLGGKPEGQTDFPLEEPSLDHSVFWIRKTSPTAAKYPRKAGTPEKNPLI